MDKFLNKTRNTFIIFQKELRSYFNSPVAYIVIITFLLISGWFFSSQIFLNKEATINHFLYNIPLLFVFIIPAVSMRLFAEELKVGTIKILTTLPVKDCEVILAKYLAAVALITIAVLATLIHPISVSFLGNIDWGQVTGSYIGLILLGACFVAIGLFASSITRNQIVAFIIGLLICFILFIIGKVLILIPPLFVSLVEYISIDYHFANISKGLIDSRDLIYYGSLSFFFLALTYIIVSSRRETKRFQVGIYSASTLLLLVGIVVVINFLSFNIFKRIDLSEGGIYSLSKASKKLVRRLEDPVIVKAYFTKNLPSPYNTQGKYLEDLLAEYKAYSGGRIKYKFIDPKESEELTKEVHAIGIPPLRFTQIEKDKYEIKEGYMGVVFIYGEKKEVIPLIKQTHGLEYDITSIIKKLTSTDKKTVGFLTGHDELDIAEDHALYSMIMANYNVRQVELKEEEPEEDSQPVKPQESAESKLEGLDSLVILGPMEKLQDQELYAIDQFLMKGKTVAFFIDKFNVDMKMFFARSVETGLEEMLKNYGVTVDDGFILDKRNQTVGITQRQGIFTMTNLVNYPLIPVVTKFKADNLIVKDLEEASFPFVSPLVLPGMDDESSGLDDKAPARDIKVRVLAESSEKSWYKRTLRSISPMQRFSPEETDKKGPLPLVATLEGTFISVYKDREGAVKQSLPSRIIVGGTSRFIDTKMPNRAQANANLFLNIVDWLVQDEALISIRSKGVTFRPLKEELSSFVRNLIKYLNIFFMPLAFIIYGLVRLKMRLARKKQIQMVFE